MADDEKESSVSHIHEHLRRTRRQSWADADVLQRRNSVRESAVQVWQSEAQDWMESVLEKPFADLWGELETGTPLVELMMKVDPEYQPKYKPQAKPGSFFARDNMTSFLEHCKKLGMDELLMFGVDDLVHRRNDSKVLSTVLQLSRVAVSKGMKPPQIVEFELEIEKEELEDAQAKGEDVEAVAAKAKKSVQWLLSPRFSDDGRDTKQHEELEDPSQSESESDNDAQFEELVKPSEWTPYVPVKGDAIDEAVADIMNEVKPVHIMLYRIRKGCYQVGEGAYTYMRLVRNTLLVRVGGGWTSAKSFIERRHSLKKRASSKNLASKCKVKGSGRLGYV